MGSKQAAGSIDIDRRAGPSTEPGHISLSCALKQKVLACGCILAQLQLRLGLRRTLRLRLRLRLRLQLRVTVTEAASSRCNRPDSCPLSMDVALLLSLLLVVAVACCCCSGCCCCCCRLSDNVAFADSLKFNKLSNAERGVYLFYVLFYFLFFI